MQDRIKQMAEEAGFLERAVFNHGAEITDFAQAIAHEFIAISKEHDKEGYATHMMQEHARARYGIKE